MRFSLKKASWKSRGPIIQNRYSLWGNNLESSIARKRDRSDTMGSIILSVVWTQLPFIWKGFVHASDRKDRPQFAIWYIDFVKFRTSLDCIHSGIEHTLDKWEMDFCTRLWDCVWSTVLLLSLCNRWGNLTET